MLLYLMCISQENDAGPDPQMNPPDDEFDNRRGGARADIVNADDNVGARPPAHVRNNNDALPAPAPQHPGNDGAVPVIDGIQARINNNNGTVDATVAVANTTFL